MSSTLQPAMHGRYEIRLWRHGKAFGGRPFVGDKPVLPQVTEATPQLVIARLRHQLDAYDAERRSQRGAAKVPLAEEYMDTLRFLDPQIETGQRRMLRAIFDAPARTLTATDLATAAGYAGYSAANLRFGQLGQKVARELGFAVDRRPSDNTEIWTSALATGPAEWRSEAGHYPWTLRPEVVQALEGLPSGFLAGGSR